MIDLSLEQAYDTGSWLIRAYDGNQGYSLLITERELERLLLHDDPVSSIDVHINKRNPALRNALFLHGRVSTVIQALRDKRAFVEKSIPFRLKMKPDAFAGIQDTLKYAFFDPSKSTSALGRQERTLYPARGISRTIIEVKDARIYIKSPFNQGFVDALKESFHWSSRSWDPQAKVWSVLDRFNNYDHLVDLVIKHYQSYPAIRIQEPNQNRYRFVDFDQPPGWRVNGEIWPPKRKEKRRKQAPPEPEVRTPALFGDFFRVLGVPRTADTQLIKKGYRKAVKQYHPDTKRQGGDADREAFELIQRAYDTLRDEKKRKKYLIALKIKEGQLTTQTGRNDDPLPL